MANGKSDLLGLTSRTAVYVIRTYGGVGGRRREALPIPFDKRRKQMKTGMHIMALMATLVTAGCTTSNPPTGKSMTVAKEMMDMTSITGKNFGSPDEIRRPFEKGKIEVITVEGLTFYRETLEPGWQWSKHVKPVVGGESCQRFHVKIFIAGRQRVKMDDGTVMEFGPGDVAIMQPGHDAWVVGDEPNVLIELSDIIKLHK